MDDNSKLIIYGSLQAFESKVNDFNVYDKQFEENKLDESMYFDFLTAIEGVVNFYYRYIKRYYKIIKGVMLIKPIETYKRAKADGFISDADCWIEYISDLNAVLNLDESNPIKKETTRKFLDYYRKKIPLTFEHMRSEENKKILEDCKPIIAEFKNLPIKLSDEKPVYSCEYLGISYESYKIIMDFFKSKPSIKSVWMHGSRVHGDAALGSDIDIFIDCPLEDTEKIKEEIEALPIPYMCDVSNINDPEKALFIKISIHRGIKKIYSATDFQTYWDENGFKTTITPLNVSKLIAEHNVKESQFMIWQDFYNNIYKKIYKEFLYTAKIVQSGKEYNSENTISKILEFYDSINKLLFLYLNYNGFFFNQGTPSIRKAFSIGIINDGDSWIEVDYMIWKYNNKQCLSEEIINTMIKKHFNIFEELNEYFSGLAG